MKLKRVKGKNICKGCYGYKKNKDGTTDEEWCEKVTEITESQGLKNCCGGYIFKKKLFNNHQ